MIRDKTFITWDGKNTSSQIFKIEEGLQQGTVNSPILFSIFISDLPKLFEFNEPGRPALLTFADDIVVYLASNRASITRNELEKAVEKITQYFMTWNLRVNPNKCETILFRKPLANLSSKATAGGKDFSITAQVPGTDDRIAVPHKKVVKYLGVHIDYLLRGNKHTDIQLEKANRAFLANSRAFRNKYLSPKAKTILYMLLVRPIITYAAPIWWNFNHTTGEKMRCLERKCLRTCLGLYRSQSSDWRHFVKNKTLYEKAEIPRIDLFTLRLTRDYFSKLPSIDNEYLKAISVQDDIAAPRQLVTGYVAPQSFMFCDKVGLIQNSNNIPLIYHWRRNKANKRIAISLNRNIYDRDKYRYSTIIPDRDYYD